MGDNGEEKSKSGDFYQVLGLDKECTATELKSAYKKLALIWHPDRCSASGNSKFVEESKKKFQAIQQAYSVLSDSNKRFLYDIGVYDSDDDEDGMGEFLNEMAVMMSQTKPNENGDESFEELQELFEEMFHDDIDVFGTGCQASASFMTFSESSGSSEFVSSEMTSGKFKLEDSSGSNSHVQKFCLGLEHQQDFKKGKGARGGVQGRGGGRWRQGRKQKAPSDYDVFSGEFLLSRLMKVNQLKQNESRSTFHQVQFSWPMSLRVPQPQQQTRRKET